MLTVIHTKFRSGIHRIRTRLYERSDAWRRHPLNPQNFAVDVTQCDWAKLDEQLRIWAEGHQIPVQNFRVDAAEFRDFKRKMKLPGIYAVGYKDKKILEHYIAYKLLELDPSDTYLDIAGEDSPFPAIFRKKFGLDVKARELPNASNSPEIDLPDASVSKISLQCMFEHFEGKLDGKFMREVRRLLQPGGKCVIVPLYMNERHLNIIDPLLVKTVDMPIDMGAITIAEPALGGRFERIYSPASLSRIFVRNMSYSIFRIVGRERIAADPSSPTHRVRYALVASKT